jgi:gluconolactonase
VHGGQLYEGEPDAPGAPSNPAGKLNPRLERPPVFTGWKGELSTNIYRVDSNGRLDVVVTQDQVPDPNGLLLSPDYKKLHVISTLTRRSRNQTG